MLVSYIVGNNWGLDMDLDLVITWLVVASTIARALGYIGACGKSMCTVPAALLPYSIPV